MSRFAVCLNPNDYYSREFFENKLMQYFLFVLTGHRESPLHIPELSCQNSLHQYFPSTLLRKFMEAFQELDYSFVDHKLVRILSFI